METHQALAEQAVLAVAVAVVLALQAPQAVAVASLFTTNS
jgi:hypothetical protein